MLANTENKWNKQASSPSWFLLHRSAAGTHETECLENQIWWKYSFQVIYKMQFWRI